VSRKRDKDESSKISPIKPRKLRFLRLIIFVVIIGAGVGQFVPGVDGGRSVAWPIAGSLAGLLILGTYKLTRLFESRLGRATGYAGVIVLLSLLSTLFGLTPYGCNPCSAVELQSWTSTGFATGFSVVLLTIMVSTTSSIASLIKRLFKRYIFKETETFNNKKR